MLWQSSWQSLATARDTDHMSQHAWCFLFARANMCIASSRTSFAWRRTVPVPICGTFAPWGVASEDYQGFLPMGAAHLVAVLATFPVCYDTYLEP